MTTMKQANLLLQWTFLCIAFNGFGLGEVAEPEAKLEHETLKLKTND